MLQQSLPYPDLRRRWLYLVAILLVLSPSVGALADETEEPTSMGLTPSALPGFNRVEISSTPRYEFAVAADGGYANTEALAGSGASHHRYLGSIAVAYVPVEWLLLSGGLAGQYDRHRENAETQTSASGVPSFAALLALGGPQLSYGLELGLAMPGEEAPSIAFDAATPSVKGLVTFQASRSWVFASNVGYRLDRSARAAPDARSLDTGDRVALGASEFDAVLVGLAAGAEFSRLLAYVEMTGELLTGADLATSPMRATLGAKYVLTTAWQIDAHTSAGLSDRPADPLGVRLVPLEPRFSVGLGLRFLFGGGQPVVEQAPERREPVAQLKEPEVEQPKAPATHLPSRVRGSVLDFDGEPLPQVQVSLRIGEQRFSAMTDERGVFAFDAIPPGRGTLEAATVDYEPTTVDLEIDGKGAKVTIEPLKMQLQALGAQLQGLIQTFDGEPLQATVRVVPPGKEYQTELNGRFAIDIEPGSYEIEISKDGYVTQKHRVTVGDKAVIVINVDLRKSP